MVGHSLAQAVVGFHGVVAVVGSLGADEGSVVGNIKNSDCMGAFDGTEWGSIKISWEISPKD